MKAAVENSCHYLDISGEPEVRYSIHFYLCWCIYIYSTCTCNTFDFSMHTVYIVSQRYANHISICMFSANMLYPCHMGC